MVLAFGETLLRLAPDEKSKWLAKNAINIYPGGYELNVAVALSKWKIPISYCTALPGNFLSAQIIKYIEEQKIDISTIQYHGDKISLYYQLEGKDVQHTETIYDREHSSFYNLKPGIIDWDKTLQGIRWFHFSGISPSLNKNVAAVCEEALKVCASKGITVSVDLNYPPKIWHNKNAYKVIAELVTYCDIIATNIWTAENILNITIPPTVHSISTKESCLMQSKSALEQIMQKFPKCKVAANAFSLHKNNMEYFGTVIGNNKFYSSATYKTDNVVDETGTGDSFMAGLIYGIYNHLPFQQLINFATGAAFQKLFVKGGFIDKPVDEIKSFILHHH